MGKFLLGLVIGVIMGVLAVTYSPSLAEDVRGGLASLTALVMRGAEEAAEGLEEATDEAREATGDTDEAPPPASVTEGAELPAEGVAPEGQPAPAQ